MLTATMPYPGGVAAVLLSAVTVVGCGSPTTTPSPPVGANGLQTLAPGPMPTCGGTGITRAVIRGDQALADPVWLEVSADRGRPPTRLFTIWPFGYSARFVPALEIVSSAGDVIAREGTVVTDVGLCGLAGERFLLERIGEYWLMPTP